MIKGSILVFLTLLLLPSAASAQTFQGDDQVNPPELGIMEREIKRVKRGRYILIPISDKTRGHGTHSLPAVWQQHLARLLNESRTRQRYRTVKTDRKSHISVDIRGQTD
jgi:hypothetical protein